VALGLNEISYLHSRRRLSCRRDEAALIDENLPVVILATRDRNDPGSLVRYAKTLSSL
jgi:hypothetical protein